MSAPTFFYKPVGGGVPSAGDSIVLGGDEGRHAAMVQRLRAGESIHLVDGDGLRIAGSVEVNHGKSLTVRVAQVTHEPPPAIEITLVQALAKADRAELAISTATELGVSAVIPWQAANCVVRWRGDRTEKSQAKWHDAVRAATKQSRRSWLPRVHPVVDSRGLAQQVAQAVATGVRVLVLHEEATRSLVGVVDADVTPMWLVVGPEGGIGTAETASLVAAGGVVVKLGDNVLRTSTAGAAAIAATNALCGAWA
ncbi:16S rRNA (uracil(1498)-N(3))-methyltransferase [Rarobacter incanus]|uniref:Ribosomal RNA small subunit methyltransferase E n=1 Tax=Rarobacter incanus TaxID=153494 RepID=A0A542SMT2_9MICO|nr:16S rRNA (uracil(1498)-N(3))-methyltransferase [Rarobacter incanus]TQK75943.1 16S rRNA (uracil1498-N3)-methyltransferase [Rarobacter incanus]